jgi:hypothetical protein
MAWLKRESSSAIVILAVRAGWVARASRLSWRWSETLLEMDVEFRLDKFASDQMPPR